ncbi:hypothetical protein SUDANB174_00282 [Streptomyces sp. enrichment culture]
MTTAPGGSPAAATGTTEVVEYTDPLCPWAWGSEPALRRLRAALPAGVRWRRVFGILFDEDDDPAPAPPPRGDTALICEEARPAQ